MEILGTEVSIAALVAGAVLGTLMVVVVAATLVDLSRRRVRHLPKWAWALVIVLVSFPIGVILYLVVGRVPPAEEPADAPPARASGANGPAPEGADPVTGDLVAAAVATRATGAGPGPPPPAPTTGAAGRGADGTPAVERDAVVLTRGLGKAYGDTAALTDVDLTVPRGATYGLIGPNGAGKTTLLSILAGLRHPTSGTVDIAVPRASVGVLVDTPRFEPWLTAYEVVDLARTLTAPGAPAARVEEVLDETGLAPAADRRVGGFSRGMLQRLGLASCLVADPEVFVLDEPSSALDPAGRREVLDLVGRLARTRTVLLSTHILSDVQQVCDVVGVIDHGRLRYQGPLADLLAHTSTVYALHVRERAGELAAALRARSWVQQVTQPAPGRLRLVVADATRAEHEVPALLGEHGIGLVSFQPATDLETAFLELTS